MSDKVSGTQNITITLTTVEGDITISMADVEEIFFMEDVTSSCISGKLTFTDRFGTLEKTSFTGHELITIVYGETDKTIQQSFMIYGVQKISETVQTEGSSFSKVELLFTEASYSNLALTTFSRSWNNEKISTIVKSLCIDFGGTGVFGDRFEESNEKISFCMPYWTPIESINWLMKRASGVETNTAGYLLYSNNKGLNFVTLEKLLKGKDIDEEPYSFNVTTTFNKILTWSTTGIDKTNECKLEGGMKLGVNFDTKCLITQLYDYKTCISKYTMMGQKTLFPDISKTTCNISIPGDSNTVFLKNIAYSDFIKRYMYQLQVKISVQGHEKRHVGQLVNILWNSRDKKEYIHNAMDGQYMITTIVNQFNSKMIPTWKQNMVLIKTAYTDSRFKKLHNSTIISETLNKKGVGK